MDPRFVFDPSFRSNPEAMRQMAAEVRREARQRVFGSIRINNLVMTVLGWLFLVLGAVAGGLFFAGVAGPDVPIFGILAPLFLVMAAPFLLLARLTRITPRGLLREGISAQARVREVRSLGRSMGVRVPGVHNATVTKVTMVLDVWHEGAPPFTVSHSEFVLGSDFQALQIGSTLPVRLSPRDVTKLAIDWEAMPAG
jgi:hypothetical protein